MIPVTVSSGGLFILGTALNELSSPGGSWPHWSDGHRARTADRELPFGDSIVDGRFENEGWSLLGGDRGEVHY